MLAARTMLPLRSSRTVPFSGNEVVNEGNKTMATVSELIAERQKHLSESWQSFLRHPLHSSIAQVIGRKNTNLPSDYVPWAPAIAIASSSLLKAAGRARHPDLWRKHQRYGYYHICEVRIKERCGFWFIERGDWVLVFRLGSMPICTRTHSDAIALFEHVFRQFENSYDPPLGPRGIIYAGSEKRRMAF
jgi:hypothetical protein